MLLHRAAGQKVSGELEARELVKRHVVVQRVDYPVPPPPGVRTRKVLFVTVRVGVMRQVEPLARPALPVMGRSEKTVHNPFVSVRARVGQEFLDLLGRGWKTREIERDPAEQGGSGGFRRGRNAFLFQPRQHEIVNRIARPAALFDRRRRRTFDPLKGPMGRARAGGRLRQSFRCFRPDGAGVDPGPEHSDFFRLQAWPRRRHPLRRLFGVNALDQPRGAAVSRNDRRTRVTAA